MPTKTKKPTAELIGMPWDFASLWNESLRTLQDRPLRARDYIYASEIGGDFATRYLKMHGHKFSNPYNDRSKRKMIAGTIWEWVVGLVLTTTGILKSKQLRGEVQLPGLLKVSGRLDFIAGGDIDWVKAKEEVKRIQNLFSISIDDMPPFIFHAIEKILNRMEQMFTRVPLREVVLECKSVSGFVSDLIERSGKPRPTHPFQVLHYMIANKMSEGMLVYVCRDSAMLHQFAITLEKPLLKAYSDDVKQMTEYYNNSGKNYIKNIPPKAPEVLFEEATFRFVKNNMVEYSPYLSFLYPEYKDFDDFKNKWVKILSSWNRVMRRTILEGTEIVTTRNGKESRSILKLTEGNKIVRDEIRSKFPEFDKYVAKAKAAGAFIKSEEEDEETN